MTIATRLTPDGFTASGPQLNNTADAGNYGWVGRNDSTIRRHDGVLIDTYVTVPLTLQGGPVTRISETASTAARALFVMTASTATGTQVDEPGHVYRLTSGATDLSLDLWGGSQAMSRKRVDRRHRG